MKNIDRNIKINIWYQNPVEWLKQTSYVKQK